MSFIRNLSSPQFERLHQQMTEQGGFTFDPKTGKQPSEGIAVSDRNAEQRVRTEQASPETLGNYAQLKRDRLAQPGAHLGGWDSGSQHVYDTSEVISPHPRGHEIADVHHRMHTNRQEAAFNLGNFEEVANPQWPYSNEMHATPSITQHNDDDPSITETVRVIPRRKD